MERVTYDYGYGYGNGYGNGYGYGCGDSCGDGDGYGDGYGYGDSYGDGYGTGYGNGYGTDILSFCIPPQLYARVAELRSQGVVIALWKSNCDGYPANSGSGGPRHVGMIEEESGPLQLCSKGTLHATLNPGLWRGTRMWLVALYPPVIGDEDKYGSLKREILAEVPFCI